MSRLPQWQEQVREDLSTAHGRLAGFDKGLELLAKRVALVMEQTADYDHLCTPMVVEIRQLHESASVARGPDWECAGCVGRPMESGGGEP